ncbi:MAG: glycine betaine ABC transporter substrate-binding protein [Burkholderiales bacterium]
MMALGQAALGDEIRIGSKRFTESYILGEILTQSVVAAGETSAAHKPGLGNTAIVFAALKSGAIDAYPEYTGTIDKEILKNATVSDLASLNRQLAPLGLGVAVPLGFNNTYALAIRADQAEKLGIKTLSDLAKHPELRLGFSQEFIGRADGWDGLKRAYGLPFATPQGIDHGLAYDAIANGQIDLTDIYATDAKIEKFKLRVLPDDRSYFPAYEAVVFYRLDVALRFPKSWTALQRLTNTIADRRMIHMNAEAELNGKDFATVAGDFLREQRGAAAVRGSSKRGFWDKLFAEDFGRLTAQHLLLVFVSLALSIIVAVPLGIWAARSSAMAKWVLSLSGVIQTVPSLALLAFLIPVFDRIGTLPALAALFLYALLPIVRNTYAGLTQIPLSLRESASALGLPALPRLRLIELPLAMGTILAGIKTAAIINVGTATIAAFIGAGGYGERIAQGLALNDHETLLAGAVPAAVLALLVQWGFDGLERWIIPAGLRAA